MALSLTLLSVRRQHGVRWKRFCGTFLVARRHPFLAVDALLAWVIWMVPTET